jgi:hypothetical protein
LKHFLPNPNLRLAFFLLLMMISQQSCQTGTSFFPDFLGSPSMPDSTINHTIQLRNAAETPGWIKNAIIDTQHVAVLTTSNEMEYLIAYQDPDGERGTFIGFEITSLTSDLLDFPSKKVKSKHFMTENGIYLRMPIEEVLNIKGRNFFKHSENGITTYRYFGAPKDFLSRHRSEEYMFEFEEVEKRVSRIRFGFIGPMVAGPQENLLQKRAGR